jgi:hypothetical protein
MQRFRPDVLITFYVTASVAGRALSPQVSFSMAEDHSRTYSYYEDDDGAYGRMESVPNSGAEDDAPDAEKMDTERSRHGKISASKQLDTENDSEDSNDSSTHTPAQKPKRRRFPSTSPCRSPSPLPMEPELEPINYDSLSDSTPRRKTGFRRPRIQWTNVSSWNTDQIPESAVQDEISRIMAASLADAKVEVTPKANEKAISHFRLKMVRLFQFFISVWLIIPFCI